MKIQIFLGKGKILEIFHGAGKFFGNRREIWYRGKCIIVSGGMDAAVYSFYRNQESTYWKCYAWWI